MFGTSCMWIRQCCSHIRPFFMWLLAIFPSLPCKPENPKTNATTDQTGGSPLCNMPSHPNTIGPMRQWVWCHGVIFITRAPHEHWNSNSGPDEGLSVVNGHCPLQPALLLQGTGSQLMALMFQGQKGINHSSDVLIADQIMWCDILYGYFKAAPFLICFQNDITAAVWAPRELFYAPKNTSLQPAGPSNTKSKAHSVSLYCI